MRYGLGNRMATRVFISYRRATGSGYALLIYDHLHRKLPDVFRDQNSLTPGKEFGDQLEQEIGRCKTLIVVVTPGWAEVFRAHQTSGEPDWVLREIGSVQAPDKQVIPVLAGGATARELTDAPNLPELARVRGIQGISLDEKNHETVLDELASLLWNWPPALYWVSSALLLTASLVCADWLARATEWGANWWAVALVLLIAWIAPNVVALSGRFLPRLPGTGPLRALGSSFVGPLVGLACIVAAAAPAVVWRVVRVEGSTTQPSVSYRLTQKQSVWARAIESRAAHVYWFPAWSWTPVEMLNSGGTAGRCIASLPAAFGATTVVVPDDLASNAIVINATEDLKNSLAGAQVGVTLTPLFGDRRGTSVKRDPYRAEPVPLDLNPCESRPTAVEVAWIVADGQLAHIRKLGQQKPTRYAVSANGDIVIGVKDSE
jgi:hypothetical protein